MEGRDGSEADHGIARPDFSSGDAQKKCLFIIDISYIRFINEKHANQRSA